MIDLKLIGNRIRELRQKHGLTQGELAADLSVSFQAVSNWERGIAPPDIENLLRIATYFEVLVDTLLSPIGQSLYLGIDGGGTKTEFALVSSSGRIFKHLMRGSSNPNDIGFSATKTLICDAIREILTEYPTVEGVFCGIAGISTGNYAKELYNSVKGILPHAQISMMSDAFNLFALDESCDMVVISGTGSVVFAKDKDGFRRIGGWGYLFDNAGSAYDIARDGIALALGEEDSGKEPSLITKLLLKKMNTSTVWENINTLYKNGKPYIASFASAVFEAYKEGDAKAYEIIDRNAKALAELLNTGIRLYSATPAAVASGGLFEHYPEILSNHMKKYCDVRLTVSPLPPIYGACKRACPAISADFYENFKKSYGEIKK